ncbi:sugar kinase [Paenarthrobacter sp. Z7-10]|uniref:sugar kinase n=1 Tax=Paenarthrobacter sp. Z7-10 TaxID=2787635 RepID=UPI0022A98375|nr:sugar kinase [Paenarthrobacter sp. Z7-10]MCZ2403384.1 sugar kinase [Paenarthrobacter sp. Z7-10]
MPSAVCIGETMAMLTPRAAPLHEATELLFGIGGAESNVAMGLSSMGLPAHWIGRVGRDGFGTRILNDLRAHGVGTSGVEVDPVRPTGLYVKVPAVTPAGDPSVVVPADPGIGDKEGIGGRVGGPPVLGQADGPAAGMSSVIYYRSGSAASAMGPATLANPAVASLLREAALIHLSGITAALSEDCAELSRAILRAERKGRIISFDVNWRPALWAGRDASILAELANLADVVLMGRDEAELAFGTDDESRLRRLLPDPEVLVIKNADISATALCRDGSRVDVPALRVEVVEPVGAGDAFAAGYLSGMALGLDQKSCLRRGHLSAASTLIVNGDRGALPPAHMVAAILAGSDEEWAAMRMMAGVEGAAAMPEEAP